MQLFLRRPVRGRRAGTLSRGLRSLLSFSAHQKPLDDYGNRMYRSVRCVLIGTHFLLRSEVRYHVWQSSAPAAVYS